MGLDFVGKPGLVVGGTSGIGRAVARPLMKRGVDSVTLVGRNAAKRHAAESEQKTAGELLGRDLDITNRADLARVLEDTNGPFTKVDLLVNAADVFGVGSRRAIPPSPSNMTGAIWDVDGVGVTPGRIKY